MRILVRRMGYAAVARLVGSGEDSGVGDGTVSVGTGVSVGSGGVAVGATVA